MLKLYGFGLSNYYNVVKLTLLEKGIEFTEIDTRPSASNGHLERSPMGKIPCLEIEDGRTLSESQVILDYIEETRPEPALYPADAFERAKVRELLRIIELYLELPARRLFPQAFFGQTVTDQTRREAGELISRGAAALARLGRFHPYIVGDVFTYGDISAVIHLPIVSRASKAVLGQDVLADIPELPAYLGRLRERPAVIRVLDDQNQAMAAFMRSGGGG